MNHEKVDSSTIRSIAYDEDRQEMHVDFHKSGRYVYHKVNREKYEGMMNAASKGDFLHKHVKGQHHHRKA